MPGIAPRANTRNGCDTVKPLENIRIVDMTTYAAGPSATRILADLGADVIKIEPPFGDAFRVWGKSNRMPIENDENPSWEMDNANKRGIAVDLKTKEGLEIIDRLIAGADAFVSNYRASALEKMGLTYEKLHEKYPKLVYGFLSGYGTKGPEAKSPGFDYVAFWARGGPMEISGHPGAEPGNAVIAGGDQISGAVLAGAVCTALIGAMRTGIGQKVETSLYHSALWLSSLHLMGSYYWENPRADRTCPSNPVLNVFRCRDERWISLCILEHERYWPILCSAFGWEDLVQDSRFCTFGAARANSAELTAMIDRKMLEKTVDEWETIFTARDIPAQRVLNAAEINEDEQALANGYLKPFTFRSGNTINMTTPPLKFSGGEDWEIRGAPQLGEHTREILAEVGYSSDEIRRMEENKVVRSM